VHAHRSAGESLFFGDGEESFELVEVHGVHAQGVNFDYASDLWKGKELQICFMGYPLRNLIFGAQY
jgi:hypothetical protein